MPDDETAFVEEYFERIRDGDIDAVLMRTDPQLVITGVEDDLRKIVAIMPDTPPVSFTTIDYGRTVSGDGTFSTIIREYEFADTWLLVTFNVRRADDALTMASFNLRGGAQSLVETNAFSIDGRGPVGYLVLLLVVAIPIVCIVSFIACLMTPIPKRKWLWCLFTLLGFGTFSMDWTSGQVAYQVISVQLLGAGAVQPYLYGPWIFSFALPLGAIIFWTRRPEWLRAAAASATIEATVEPDRRDDDLT